MPLGLRSRLGLLLMALEAALGCLSFAQAIPGGVPGQAVGPEPQNIPGMVRLVGNRNREARPEFDLGPVPDGMPQGHILLMLRRPPERERSLQQFIESQYDPQSPNFHRWLTPEEFGERFGPAAGGVDKVTGWLSQRGFTINNVPAGGLFVDFSGTAGQLQKAFHTEIHRYRIHGVEHVANSDDPFIPQELAPFVAGFRSLDDFHPHPHLHQLGVAHLDRKSGKWTRPQGEQAHLTEGIGSNATYIVGPQDFAEIYGIRQVWNESVAGAALVGSGQTIGVVGESGIDSADIQTFRDQFGITALGPQGSVLADPPPAGVCAAPDPADNEPESYLDVEWAGATAPGATIDFVACGRQGDTSGADLAAAYIVQDPAHAQRISVLSTSYGDCEALPNSEANQFYVSLWQQAAAEGITVVVAAGDTGGDGCQSVGAYATNGLSVVNEASTPYNIAAGGTDFSDVFSGTARTYWTQREGANFQTAQSYIPEMAWNESCASPLVLQHFAPSYSSGGGPNGFCTYASQQPANPNTAFSPFFLAFAGSGGQSVVSSLPSWQTGVPGLPSTGGRAVPDIAMFASGGYAWGQTLILCDSGLQGEPGGAACDFSNENDVYVNDGGGTSFVAPAFAGIMALIDQKSGSRQGQANYVLYPLAAQEYALPNSKSQPSEASCAAYLGAEVLSGCYFHDISATPNPNPATQKKLPFLTGTTSVPCTGTAGAAGVYTGTTNSPASDNQNCYDYEITVAAQGGSLLTTPDYYGVLSTAQSANAPAFAASPGYDLTTGLGSPNVYALVNAPQWSSGGQAAQIRLAAAKALRPREAALRAEVTSSDGHAVQSGSVSFYNGNTLLGSVPLRCGGHGAVLFPLSVNAGQGASLTVFAFYSGGADSCHGGHTVYYGAHSNPVAVVVGDRR